MWPNPQFPTDLVAFTEESVTGVVVPEVVPEVFLYIPSLLAH